MKNGIDKDKIVNLLETKYGAISAENRGHLMILLAMLAADEKVTDIRHASYLLATVKHETRVQGVDTWAPVEEIGKGKNRPYGKPDPVTGKTYYGRGYSQLTHADNYKRIGKCIGIDLYHNPERACQYNTAYQVLSYGMRNGAFTGVGLNRFIHGDVCDYVGARKIINGNDKAELIAVYAREIEAILRDSLV